MLADGRSSRAHAPRVIDSAGAPTPEALSATRIAAAAVRELYDRGREVRFVCAPSEGRVAVLLCELDGDLVSPLTPSSVLEIADGEQPPGTRWV